MFVRGNILDICWEEVGGLVTVRGNIDICVEGVEGLVFARGNRHLWRRGWGLVFVRGNILDICVEY